MSETLFHACKGIICASFREGMDKHAAKHAHKMHKRIFSYSTLGNVLDTISIFCTWLKQNGYRCRRPMDITPQMVTDFLCAKAQQNFTQATLDTYRSRLGKLGKCISARKRINFSLRVPRVKALVPGGSPSRGAQAVMPRDDYNVLLDYALRHPSGSGFVLLLENHLGVRVTDICEQATLHSDHILMVCKGGKRLRREITPELAALIHDKRFTQYISPEGKLLLPRSGTVNKYLAYHQIRFGLARNSFHNIRRLLAQEHYDMLRRSGYSIDEALNKTGEWLNHGPDRKTLVKKSYVANVW